MSDLRTILLNSAKKPPVYEISPDWRGTIPFWLTFENDVTLTIPANGVLGGIPIPLRDDGIFRGEYLLSQYEDLNYLLRLNTTGGYRFNNNDVPVMGRLVASALAGRPGVLPEAIMVRYKEQLTLELTDTSGADNDINFAIAGLLYVPVRFGTNAIANRLRRELSRYNLLRPHWAAPDGDGSAIVVPAGGQIDFTINIDQTGFFEVAKLGVWADNFANVSMRLWDPGDRSLSTFQMALPFWGGEAEYPFIIPVKWGLRPNTIVRGTFYNTAGVDRNVYFALIGRRLIGDVTT